MLSEADIERAGGVTSPRLVRSLSDDQLIREGVLPPNFREFPLGDGEHYGQVATNCRIATAQSTDGLFSTFSHNRHTLRADVTEIAIVLPNWFANRNGDKWETGIQSGVVASVGIQFPAGTIKTLGFGGAAQGGMAAGGQICTNFIKVSDLTNGASEVLPAGTEIETRIALYGSVGYAHANFRQNQYATFPEGSTASGGTGTPARVPDLTRRFATVATDPPPRSVGTWPVGIIARTTHPGVLIIGDSINEGTGDIYAAEDAVDKGFGLVGRAVAPTHAYISAAMAGDDIETILQSHHKRLSLATYVKRIVFEHGVNSISGLAAVDPAIALATMKTNMLALWRLGEKYSVNPDTRRFQTTLTPETTSTDNFATANGQTARSGFSTSGNGVREQLNDWLRDRAPLIGGAPAPALTGASGAVRAGEAGHPLYGVFEVADQVETARNSGRWKVDGTANKWTADGIHPTRYTNDSVATSGAIDVERLAA
ncbi:hypothetical protein J2X65_003477 [Ancylobacter sp. 3268]|uniref:hypothetical protein n=1 Tax=Ancylobacter sp. 3268 TaxID=2817752 RepID=UPI0028546E8B|nr:hypothetical protein [Ancylobacter sp. 3268]MDR6954109.1 hypothetical protein [Ancylobacter sp. 3268]